MTESEQFAMRNSSDVVLEAIDLNRYFREGGQQIHVLRQVSLRVHAGEMVSIVGASGSGKSTLLHCLGLLDRPDEGEVQVGGQSTARMRETQRSAIRNAQLGFVYQFHHLLGEFNALDNVAMPLVIRNMSREKARQKARVLLEDMGLGERVTHFPGQLSGGERQRVALARALVSEPRCVLADEPTGNLDRQTAQNMFALLRKVQRERGLAIVIVTHDLALAARTDRVLSMVDGQLKEVDRHTLENLQTPLTGDSGESGKSGDSDENSATTH